MTYHTKIIIAFLVGIICGGAAVVAGIAYGTFFL